MNVRWTAPALIQWKETLGYIESDNFSAAARMAERILEAVEMLAAHPYAGKTGKIAATREFAVPRSPFVIVYGVDPLNGVLSIYAVYDGRRRWPKVFPKD